MADHHDAQDYTANGPTEIGFRTGGDGTGITKGVVATGTEVGVFGRGVGVENTGPAVSIGVVGEGTRGVVGRGFVGVSGEGSTGVEGFGDSSSGMGVRGVGRTGVFGVGQSEEGQPPIGVSGTTDTKYRSTGVPDDSPGVGVAGNSAQGTGVRGTSAKSYGGVFSSNFAQLRLEPAVLRSGPPTTGTHLKGEFFVDASGALFYFHGQGWTKLAGRSFLRTSASAVIDAIRRAFGP